MHAAATLSLLALVGSALAAPAPIAEPVVVYETEVVVKTVHVTHHGPRPTEHAPPRYTPAPQPQPTVVYTTQVAPEPKPVTTQEPAPAPSAAEAPSAPEPQPSYAAPPPSAGVLTDYMNKVNKWRATIGKPALKQSSKLEGNIADTCASGNGEMVHKLNPGTMGQVLAPATCEDEKVTRDGQEMDGFDYVFAGGWICEISSLPGMAAVCPALSKGWTYQGQTGHAEILSSDSYTEIGCACEGGIMGCDLS